MSDPLQLLPTDLASRSASEHEIVLPLREALAALTYLEAAGHRVLGWEGWLMHPDGSRGHSARFQGTVNLEEEPLQVALEFSRATIAQAHAEYAESPEIDGADLWFCLSVAAK